MRARNARVLGSLLLATALVHCHAGTAPVPELPLPSEAGPERVVVISVAGLTPAHYRGSAEANAPMPTLARVAEAGAWASVLSPVTPAAVYPVHATLVTGLRPDRHTVTGDQLLGERGIRAARYRHASRVEGIPLWQPARDASLRVAALNWPSTLGAAIDVLMPSVQATGPGETWLSLQESGATPWIAQRLLSAAPRLPDGKPDPLWPNAEDRDDLTVELACEAAQSVAAPHLYLLRFESSEGIMALYGPNHPAASAAMGRIDARIQTFLDCLARLGASQTTALLVMGDRAFVPVHTLIEPNVILAEIGLIGTSHSIGTQILSWQVIARSNGGSAFVYAENAELAVLARETLEDASRRFGGFRVVPARELQRLHADRQAWFGLAAEPGYVFSNGVEDPAVRSSLARGAGGYLPESGTATPGFVAWGAGLRRSLQLPEISQVDIAPTIAALLGVKLPDADGRPFVGLLQLQRTGPQGVRGAIRARP